MVTLDDGSEGTETSIRLNPPTEEEAKGRSFTLGWSVVQIEQESLLIQ